MWLLVLATILVLSEKVKGASNSSYANIHPIDNFCQRLWHQSVVKDDVLYIDGGLEVFIPYNNHGTPKNGDPIVGPNTYMVMVGLNSSWNWGTNISITAMNKTVNSNTGALPPSNIRGAMYAGSNDDPNVYSYGGTVSFANRSFPGFLWPTAPTYTLWSYGASDNVWAQHDISLDVPNRPAGGAYAEATGRGMGFYLNGFLDNGTNPDYAFWPDFRRYLDGLIVLNTTTQEAKNISTSSLENYPRAMGGLVYLPNIGTEGALLSMGGVTKPSSNSLLSDLGKYVPFDSVDILDVASIDNGNSDGNWYTQTTTGEIPAPRTDFCLVTVSAPDNSSHNIYMYGGRDKTQVYDQTYVLSIPSFTWIKIMEGASPRYAHSCHVVGKSQMLTVGGARYENITQGCDWEYKSVAILNLKNSQWGEVFDYNAGEYTLPAKIYNVIGGSSMGNATMTKPSAGFSNKEIATYFSTNGITAVESSSHLSGGAIAGIVIGSVAGAAILIGIGVYILILRRRKILPKGQDHGTIQEFPSESNRHEAPPDLITARFARAIFRNRGKTAELGSQSVAHEMDTTQIYELPARSSRDIPGLEDKKE